MAFCTCTIALTLRVIYGWNMRDYSYYWSNQAVLRSELCNYERGTLTARYCIRLIYHPLLGRLCIFWSKFVHVSAVPSYSSLKMVCWCSLLRSSRIWKRSKPFLISAQRYNSADWDFQLCLQVGWDWYRMESLKLEEDGQNQDVFLLTCWMILYTSSLE